MEMKELTDKYIVLDERVTRHTEQIKTCFSQIAEAKSMSESVHKLATTVELLARDQKTTINKVDALTNKLDEIEGKPAKRWENVVSVAITAIVTALITFALTKIGLG